VAYKNEGFEMFGQLMSAIWEEFARYIFRVEVRVEQPDGDQAGDGDGWGGASRSSSTRPLRYAGGTAADQPSALAQAAAAGGAPVAAGVAERDGTAPEGGAPSGPASAPVDPLPTVETRHVDDEQRIGRNDPCWCGSGKKYKRCHGA
jgi:preprotein translocase subunit SecA